MTTSVAGNRHSVISPKAYGRQLLRHLIATVLLVAITALAWLSLIGFAPTR